MKLNVSCDWRWVESFVVGAVALSFVLARTSVRITQLETIGARQAIEVGTEPPSTEQDSEYKDGFPVPNHVAASVITGEQLPPYRAGSPEVPPDRRSPIPFCITRRALADVLTTIGQKPPETGGKGFGSMTGFGVDTFEFDAYGSSGASGSVYAPDTEWSDARHDYWQAWPPRERKLWVADLHSHPGSLESPSGKNGAGLGDLGYVEEIFRENEWMQHFFVVILSRTGDGREVTVTPWLVSRDSPHRPLLADLVVCDATEFPERTFNPAFEHVLANLRSA